MASLLAYCFRNRWVSAACLMVLVAACVLPPQGFGLPLCQFKLMTHLPCLACGLTRSFVGMAHGDVGRAGFYHPAGVILFPAVAAVALLLPAPARVRDRIAAWTEKRGPLWNYFAAGFAVLFVVNGVARVAWLVVTSQPSPW